MTAIAAARKVKRSGAAYRHHSLPMKGSTTIYEGTMVMLNASGLAIAATDDTGLKMAGVALRTVVNAGADSAKDIPVESGCFWMANDGSDEVGQADVGATGYALDNQTISQTDGTSSRSPAGKILAIDSSLGVLVELALEE